MENEWTLLFFLPENGKEERVEGSGDQDGATLIIIACLKKGWSLVDVQQNAKSVEACRLLKLLNENGVKLTPN